jgi:hypothetical protein
MQQNHGTVLYSGKGDESNFLAQYSRREENFTEEAFTKESEFQKLFEIKKKKTELIEVGRLRP